MYAVIQTGGKQYRVAPGDTIRVEKLAGEAGDSINFEQILLVSDGDDVKIGQPVVESATVAGEIVEHGRGEKLIVYKFMRRKDYRRKNGHRQSYTAVKINEVSA